MSIGLQLEPGTSWHFQNDMPGLNGTIGFYVYDYVSAGAYEGYGPFLIAKTDGTIDLTWWSPALHLSGWEPMATLGPAVTRWAVGLGPWYLPVRLRSYSYSGQLSMAMYDEMVYDPGQIYSGATMSAFYASQSYDHSSSFDTSSTFDLYSGTTWIGTYTIMDFFNGSVTAAPGAYRLVSAPRTYQAGAPGGTAPISGTLQATFEFDTRRADPNPPTVANFRVEQNGVPTSAPVGRATIRMDITDTTPTFGQPSNTLKQVTIEWRPDGGPGWILLPVQQLGSEYSVSLEHNGPVNLRVTAVDPSDNVFREEWSPAYVGTANPVRPPGDFDGDGKGDLAYYRPSNRRWYWPGGPAPQLGEPGDHLVAADYNGDGAVEIGVWRPRHLVWLRPGMAPLFFGSLGDIPVPADYDGNGTADVAVFRPSNGWWYREGMAPVVLGAAGDLPVPGNYRDDSAAEPAVFRPSTGVWYVHGMAPVPWGVPGDVPVPGSYAGTGHLDLAVWRPSTGTWFIRGVAARVFGAAGDVPAPTDLDGDGRTELVVYRPQTGTWYAYNLATGETTTVQSCTVGDIPAFIPAWLQRGTAADVDGEWRADLTVFRPATGLWYTALSSTFFATSQSVQWGAPGDVPVPGDFDGDRRMDRAVYRPSAGVWYLRFSSALAPQAWQWGGPTDTPVAADFDGDGRADLCLFSPSTGVWYVRNSQDGYATTRSWQWGGTGDVPLAADFDGDAIADPAVYRPSQGQWYVRFSTTGLSGWATWRWGDVLDVPVAGDYDGDGRADLAVFRPSTGTWHVLTSVSGYRAGASTQWGAAGDLPVPGDYNGDRAMDVAVFRPSTGTWYVRGLFTARWGANGDIPLR